MTEKQNEKLQNPGRNALIAGVGTFIGANAAVFLLASAIYFSARNEQTPPYKELVKTAYFINTPSPATPNPLTQANGMAMVLAMIGALKAAGEVYEDTQKKNEEIKHHIKSSHRQK